jgi:hypothetical protein
MDRPVVLQYQPDRSKVSLPCVRLIKKRANKRPPSVCMRGELCHAFCTTTSSPPVATQSPDQFYISGVVDAPIRGLIRTTWRAPVDVLRRTSGSTALIVSLKSYCRVSRYSSWWSTAAVDMLQPSLTCLRTGVTQRGHRLEIEVLESPFGQFSAIAYSPRSQSRFVSVK